MKNLHPDTGLPSGSPASRRPERGSLVVPLFILLTIMLIYVTANIRTLSLLKQELRVVEKRQTDRWQRAGTATNLTQAGTNATPARRAAKP